MSPRSSRTGCSPSASGTPRRRTRSSRRASSSRQSPACGTSSSTSGPSTSACAHGRRADTGEQALEVSGFDVPAESYDAFMGRYSRHLSAQLADLAGVEAGQHVLDVGSGPGALTVELARRLGPEAVTAVDPSDEFVLAVRSRVPGATVVRGSAESLPLPDGA